MVTSERQDLILQKLIKEYVGTAKPVSSQKLEKKCDFGVCPATIRREMQKLTDKGFLYQPHTSAGRVPTDKAYRFFVDKFIETEIEDFKEDFEIGDWLEKEIADTLKFIQGATKNLAFASSSLALSYLLGNKVLWKEGWEEVLKEPEFKTAACISSFTKLLKSFEKEVENLELNSELKIYIGRENPFSKVKDFSIIISRCYFPNHEEGIVSLLGPKRMAYDRNITLMKSFKRILEEI